MSWLKLTTICICLFLLGFLFDCPNMGGWWFTMKCSISAGIVLAALCIQTKASLPIMFIESIFATITGVAWLQYHFSLDGWIYGQYELLLTAVTIIEVIILAWGAPWSGIFAHIRGDVRDANMAANTRAGITRSRQVSKQGEPPWKTS